MSDRTQVLEQFDLQKAEWLPRAQDGIERYRKGDMTVTVTDSQGNAIPNARVSVNQTSHAFRFGANLFMLDELETADKNEQYKRYFTDVFNMATLPFYWNATEPTEGNTRYDKDSAPMYRRPPIDRCMAFCEQHGIEPREHGLAYEHFFPAWLSGADSDTVKRAMEKRYAQIAKRYAERIPTIEVTNEIQKWESGVTAFNDDPAFIEWSFKLARRYFPHNELVINEVTRYAWGGHGRFTDKYYANIEATLLKGAPIDAIGMQYHMFKPAEREYEETRPYYDPDKLYRHMDLYAQFGKPLQVTEVTVPAYSNGGEDEEIQAKILEYLYTIWFSHPNMEQIIYWNLVDGYAHVWDQDPAVIRASQGDMTLGENYYYGGLLRFDMTPKPAYFTLKRLITQEWHTACAVTTDPCGKAPFRGFYGDYTATVEVGGKTVTASFTLSPSADNTITVVVE